MRLGWRGPAVAAPGRPLPLGGSRRGGAVDCGGALLGADAAAQQRFAQH